MATLKEKHKREIVTRLACYDAPSDVQEAIRQEYGIEVSSSQLAFYNPNNTDGAQRLSQQWKDLFRQTRKQYREDTSQIASAGKAERVRMLERAAQHYAEEGAYVLMAQMLEQIAKETGGKYTNRHLMEHMGEGGGPIQTRSLDGVDFSELTSEQIAKLAAGEDPEEVL